MLYENVDWNNKNKQVAAVAFVEGSKEGDTLHQSVDEKRHHMDSDTEMDFEG